MKSPKTRCVIGVQWGDEGKGKIVDILSSDADYVVRFQGGGNAGHTVVVGDQKFGVGATQLLELARDQVFGASWDQRY